MCADEQGHPIHLCHFLYPASERLLAFAAFATGHARHLFWVSPFALAPIILVRLPTFR